MWDEQNNMWQLAEAEAPAAKAAEPPAKPAAPPPVGGGILATLAGLQGPDIFWGAEGVAKGFQESDVKGRDNFATLAAELQKKGIDLSGPGPFTLLAPVDSAFEKHAAFSGVPISADLLKYHVIPGKKTIEMLMSDQETLLEGATLTYDRRFRKNFLDDAEIAAGEVGRKNWPSNVECDNGLIHCIDQVLVPKEGLEFDEPPEAPGGSPEDEKKAAWFAAREKT